MKSGFFNTLRADMFSQLLCAVLNGATETHAFGDDLSGHDLRALPKPMAIFFHRIVLSIEDKLNYLEQPLPPAPVAPAGQHVAPEILASSYCSGHWKRNVLSTSRVAKEEKNAASGAWCQTTLQSPFGDYALETVARILNMVPTKKVEKTPYEVCHGKAPKLSYLKVWVVRHLLSEILLPSLAVRTQDNVRAIRILIAIVRVTYDYEIWQMEVQNCFRIGYLNE
ncbi:hypothetical protein Tco_0154028 [Tanacetum coccineum]